MDTTSKHKNEIAKWTIIMQVSAENNIFDDMMKVMEELYSIQNNPDVNFLVLFDGIKDPKFSKEFAFPAVYKIDGDTTFLLDNPALPAVSNGKFPHFNEDLSDESELEKIFQMIKTKYPAEQYGYIYKGHGGPGGGDVSNNIFMTKIVSIPKVLLDENVSDKVSDANDAKIAARVKKLADGFHYDSTFSLSGFTIDNENKNKNNEIVGIIFQKKIDSNTHFLSYKSTSNVLHHVFGKKGLEFIFLDCCWGMQLENLYSFKDCTRNFIASADEMPAAGIGYDLFYRKINQRPAISGDEIADLLVAVYYVDKYDDYDSPNPEFRTMGVSLTHADTANVDLLTDLIKKLCTYLSTNINRLGHTLRDARKCCKDYTYTQDANVYAAYNIDFLWFLESLQYFNRKSANDSNLDDLIDQIIIRISIETRKGFLASNYTKPVPGRRELGGRGFTITFPEEKSQIEYSIFNLSAHDKPAFLKASGWEDLITDYFAFIKKNLMKNDSDLSEPIPDKTLTTLLKDKDVEALRHESNELLFSLRNEAASSKWGNVIKIKK